jgi:hypothetical protein
MNRRIKYQGIELTMDAGDPQSDMPDIMREYYPWWRSARNIEDGEPVTSENIEAKLRQVERRIQRTIKKIKARKLWTEDPS